MAEQLPNGWARTKLAEVCLPVEKLNPGDFPDTEFTYFDIGGIDNKHNRIAATKNILGRSAPSRARQLVRKNDILFSTVRTYLRNIARIETDYSNSLASTGFAVIRPVTGVSSDFLFFQFLTEKFLKPLNDIQSGTSYPAVRAQDVFSQAVVIAPEIEQQRIVTKLSQAFSSIAKANAAAHRARERLRRYRFALIEAAVSGNLTAEWRESRQKEGAQLENGSAVLEHLLATRGERSSKRNSDMHPRTSVHSSSKVTKTAYPKRADVDILDFPRLPGGWEWGTLEMVAEIGSGISVSENRGVRNPIHVPYLVLTRRESKCSLF